MKKSFIVLSLDIQIQQTSWKLTCKNKCVLKRYSLQYRNVLEEESTWRAKQVENKLHAVKNYLH